MYIHCNVKYFSYQFSFPLTLLDEIAIYTLSIHQHRYIFRTFDIYVLQDLSLTVPAMVWIHRRQFPPKMKVRSPSPDWRRCWRISIVAPLGWSVDTWRTFRRWNGSVINIRRSRTLQLRYLCICMANCHQTIQFLGISKEISGFGNAKISNIWQFLSHKISKCKKVWRRGSWGHDGIFYPTFSPISTRKYLRHHYSRGNMKYWFKL